MTSVGALTGREVGTTPVAVRREKDLLGQRDIPVSSYWGIHTSRALENFAVSGRPVGDFPPLVRALAAVKLAAARANMDAGVLDDTVGRAVVEASRRVFEGELNDQFVVDLFQGGAGTSTNMNANEVIANLALEILGLPFGSYDVVHPLEHVNLSQSTNDVYPSAVKIAISSDSVTLVGELRKLVDSLTAKASEFRGVLKMGRTQLQDAVPMTVGQELGAHASLLMAEVRRVEAAREALHELNLGGTAIGTGLNAPTGYAETVIEHLRSVVGLPLYRADDLVAATSDVSAFVGFSSALRQAAIKLGKMCDDLRLLSSGPRAGLGELSLPAVQAGSSIMPGKVNPVIPELVNQVVFDVVGQDVTIGLAAAAGELQLNAFEPVMARSLLMSVGHLAGACATLRERCIDGLEVNHEAVHDSVQSSIGLVTALNPVLGYGAATQVALRAQSSGQTVAEVVDEMALMDPSTLGGLLHPSKLLGPSYLRAMGRDHPC